MKLKQLLLMKKINKIHQRMIANKNNFNNNNNQK